MSGSISPIDRYLRELHHRFRDLESGAVADYIPELAKADPGWFGVCVATVDGHVYEIGDSRRPFTIQSISKPFVYGLALEDRGKPTVLRYIGVEPSGEAFNEISLERESGRPLNPMINAGAIAATSLVAGYSHEDRWTRIQALFSTYAGRRLELNEAVYRSERETGHRNRAISHMLRNFEILESDPEAALDVYFRQCSVEVSCRDLSIMAATLATGGINPITHERALGRSNVDEVLSIMTTCGMYDYAGEWTYRIGLPAKSGVAGGILAVLPGQLGIAVFSPPLDERGNSVRGVALCEALSDEMELHFLRAPRASLSTVRSRLDLSVSPSKRARSDVERQLLDRVAWQAVVYSLQGDLSFTGIEALTRRIMEEDDGVSHIVVDFLRVGDVDDPASRLLFELLRAGAAQKRTLGFVATMRHPRLQRFLEEACLAEPSLQLVQFEELDLAVEWCEERLLECEGFVRKREDELPLEKHELVSGFEPGEVETLRASMERREYPARRFVLRKHEPSDEYFLLVQGELSVLIDTGFGGLRRLSTLSAGMGFGETFLFDHGVRTAFVRADSAATCWVLRREEARQLMAREPRLSVKLLENMLRSTTEIIAKGNREALAAAG